jgi:hypothetical protein
MQGVLLMTIKEIQQDLFNQAYIGLRNQNWQQSISYVGREPVCRYRSEVGLKCAVGHCIPDNLYKDIYEGRSFTIPFYDNAVQLTTGDCVKPGEYCRAERLILDEFISYMQAAHDSNEAPTEMQKAMNLIADTYKLEIPA